MKNGYFIISLDFELHWGLHDSLNEKNNKEKFEKARIAVEKILDLFSKYDIKATWATVGFLFAENKEEIEKINSTIKKPNYKNKNNSPYEKIPLILGLNEQEDKRHYGNSLIKKIKKTKGQEIASHTYSHYYAWEEGQNIEEFEDDVEAFFKISEKEKITISSIVYPKNQINYISILKKYGIKNYRGNPNKLYSKTKKINEYLEKIGRFLDSYFPICKTIYEIQEIKEGELNNIKASRFLRPYSKKISYLEKIKIQRIKKEMEEAAKNFKIYHIWWHPHNFSENLEENFKNLEEILNYYDYLKNKYNFESLNMAEMSKRINTN